MDSITFSRTEYRTVEVVIVLSIPVGEAMADFLADWDGEDPPTDSDAYEHFVNGGSGAVSHWFPPPGGAVLGPWTRA